MYSKMKKVTTKNEKETHEFAKEFILGRQGGEVIGLIGNLGAGKTTFVQGLAAGLRIIEKITSPTFTYIKVYQVNNHPTISQLCHIDAYRMINKDKLAQIGALEYISSPSVLTVIEWVDKFDIEMSTKIELVIKKNEREITIS